MDIIVKMIISEYSFIKANKNDEHYEFKKSKSKLKSKL